MPQTHWDTAYTIIWTRAISQKTRCCVPLRHTAAVLVCQVRQYLMLCAMTMLSLLSCWPVSVSSLSLAVARMDSSRVSWRRFSELRANEVTQLERHQARCMWWCRLLLSIVCCWASRPMCSFQRWLRRISYLIPMPLSYSFFQQCFLPIFLLSGQCNHWWIWSFFFFFWIYNT